MTLLEEIATATLEMRQKQKAYFKQRTQSALVESKQAEKHVDELLAEWQETKDRESAQMEMFKSEEAT